MQSAEIARRFLAYFEAQDMPSSPRPASSPTIPRCCSWSPGCSRSSPTCSASRPRRGSGSRTCRSACARWTSKRSARRPGTRRSSRCSATGRSATTSRKARSGLAWELLTKSEADGGFGFPEDRLWATVLHGDDESYALWRDQVGLPESRIQRRGLKDNYWHMGVPGPGGPCSEIYFDKGPGARPRGRPRGGRGPVPGGLEPGLHAGHAVRGARQGRLRRRGPAAVQERRHRHGPGADGVDPAGRRQHLRDRHHLQDPRQGGRAHRAGLRHRPRAATSRSGSSPTTCAAR